MHAPRMRRVHVCRDARAHVHVYARLHCRARACTHTRVCIASRADMKAIQMTGAKVETRTNAATLIGCYLVLGRLHSPLAFALFPCIGSRRTLSLALYALLCVLCYCICFKQSGSLVAAYLCH